ncbi:MAG: cytochrome c oxidase subunit 3 [Microscillaceae bacterium]|jgi:cytochrome c oxidase subunit 3|nr:cytochrome c oxidase subunit 3 [Microscillaceae bacterium]
MWFRTPDEDIAEQPENDPSWLQRREPNSFMLWVAIVGMALVFLALGSVYSMRFGNAHWGATFKLPRVFWLSTLVMLVSSFTLHWANRAWQKEQFKQFRILLIATWCLGMGFIGLQFWGWRELVAMKIFLQNNLAGAFLYIISGLHALHIFGGLVFLLITIVKTMRHTSYVDAFVYSVNPPNQIRLQLVTRYWHFVDILWVLLFVFFLYHHS